MICTCFHPDPLAAIDGWPQRCPTCRANAKRVRMGGPRDYHAAVCNAG